MNIPTYYDGLVKDVTSKGDRVAMWLSNERNGDWYDIYYYGEIIGNRCIASEKASTLIVAKSIKSGDEIVLFDGAVHGYDNILWQSHDDEDLSGRKLVKLDSKPVKIRLQAEYSIDYDGEKDDYNFIDESSIESDHGKTVLWSELVRNGITWLTVALIDDNGNKRCILDAELA